MCMASIFHEQVTSVCLHIFVSLLLQTNCWELQSLPLSWCGCGLLQIYVILPRSWCCFSQPCFHGNRLFILLLCWITPPNPLCCFLDSCDASGPQWSTSSGEFCICISNTEDNFSKGFVKRTADQTSVTGCLKVTQTRVSPSFPTTLLVLLSQWQAQLFPKHLRLYLSILLDISDPPGLCCPSAVQLCVLPESSLLPSRTAALSCLVISASHCPSFTFSYLCSSGLEKRFPTASKF